MIIAKVFALGAVAGFSSCGYSAVEWRHHEAFQARNGFMTSARVGGDEFEKTKIRADKDRVSISIASAFFRNLPGLGAAEAAVGLSIEGIRADQKPVRTVLDVRRGVGSNRFLSFNNLVVIEPFLYTGQNVTLTLQFQAIPDKNAPTIKAQVDGQKNMLVKIDPSHSEIVYKASDLFEKVMNPVTWKQSEWRYSIPFLAPDRVHRDDNRPVFSDGRFVFVLLPGAGAGGTKHLNPSKLRSRLRYQAGQLVDVVTGDAYTDSPYLVIDISRQKKP